MLEKVAVESHEALLLGLGEDYIPSLNTLVESGILRVLSTACYPLLFARLKDVLKGEIERRNELEKILKELPNATSQEAFLTWLGKEKILTFCQDFSDFTALWRVLSPSVQGCFVTLIGKEHLRAIIEDEHTLGHALNCLADEEHRNSLLIQLGKATLLSIIKDGNGLATVLFHLNCENRKSLVTQLAEVGLLAIIIKDGRELGEVLSKLPDQESRSNLLTHLERAEKLKAIIKNAQDVGETLASLPSEEAGSLLKRLGQHFLHSIVKDRQNLKEVLSYLSDFTTRAHLLSALGHDYVSKFLLQDSQGLAGVLISMDLAVVPSFLLQLSHERIKDIIKNGKGLSEFLVCLSSKPRYKDKVLGELGKEQFIREFLQDREDLCHIVSHFPVPCDLPVDVVRRITENGHVLGDILQSVPPGGRRAFLDLLGPNKVKEIIPDAKALSDVLWHFLPQDRVDLLNLLGRDNVKALIKNGNDLACVLSFLPPGQQKETLVSQLGNLNWLGSILLERNNQNDPNIGELVAYIETVENRAIREQLHLALAIGYRSRRTTQGPFTSCWGRLFGHNKFDKLKDAERLIKAMNTKQEIAADVPAGGGDLGKIAAAYNRCCRR